MTTEQTAQQFELAAKILRTGHPWEWQASDGEWVKPTIRTELHHVISDGLAIRLAFATPPDGRPLHNPDNLTAEQVGAGWRLTVSGETATRKEYWHKEECRWFDSHLYDETVTYRLPLSVPWPEPQPDPYAELKKAHAEGKVIQGCIRGHWIDCPHPTWKYPVNTYREKPDEKKTVPLGPEDVLPGSVIRHKSWVKGQWMSVVGNGERTMICWINGNMICNSYRGFMEEEYQINRSIPLTGKWNPDAWEPCHKEINA